MNIKNRLILFLDSQGIRKSSFGERIGVSSAYVTSIRKNIPIEKLEKIKQEYPYLNLQWLLTGEGEMLNSQNNVQGSHNQIGNNNTHTAGEANAQLIGTLTAQIDALNKELQEKNSQITALLELLKK